LADCDQSQIQLRYVGRYGLISRVCFCFQRKYSVIRFW